MATGILHLEITESALIDSSDAMVTRLEQLKALSFSSIWMTSAPGTPRSATCTGFRWTRSRSIGPSFRGSRRRPETRHAGGRNRLARKKARYVCHCGRGGNSRTTLGAASGRLWTWAGLSFCTADRRRDYICGATLILIDPRPCRSAGARRRGTRNVPDVSRAAAAPAPWSSLARQSRQFDRSRAARRTHFTSGASPFLCNRAWRGISVWLRANRRVFRIDAVSAAQAARICSASSNRIRRQFSPWPVPGSGRRCLVSSCIAILPAAGGTAASFRQV